MPCYHPRTAWRGRGGSVSFREPPAKDVASFEVLGVPCGDCIGCRVRKARDWALRCLLEDSSHSETAFVTLTYDDAHLPASGLLRKADLSGWVKRVRTRLRADGLASRKSFWASGQSGPVPFRSFRFFACGEYGEQTRRPHYHAILFGVRGGPHLQEAWSKVVGYEKSGAPKLEPLGFVRVDPCSPAAISYVAGYVGKKVGDPRYRPETREVWYREDELDRPRSRRERFQFFEDGDPPWVVSERTGEIRTIEGVRRCLERIPDPYAPFLLMSRRPGIGGDARGLWHQWAESAIWRSNPVPVPRYLHQSYKLNASDEDYAELVEKKRRDMTERIQRDARFKADILSAGEANALSLLAIRNEGRSL